MWRSERDVWRSERDVGWGNHDQSTLFAKKYEKSQMIKSVST